MRVVSAPNEWDPERLRRAARDLALVAFTAGALIGAGLGFVMCPSATCDCQPDQAIERR